MKIAKLAIASILAAAAPLGAAEAGAPGLAGLSNPGGAPIISAHFTRHARRHARAYAYRPAPIHQPYYGAYYGAPRVYYPAYGYPAYPYPAYGPSWNAWGGWMW